MAINPSVAYPGQVDTLDAVGYPYGRARNVAAVGDGTGTPLEQLWVSDLFGAQQALLSAAGITPTGIPDKVGASQYLDALKTVTDARTAAAIANSKLILTAGLQDWTRGTIDSANLIPSQIVGVLPVRSLDVHGERQRMPLIAGLNPASRLAVSLSASGNVYDTPRLFVGLGAINSPTASSRGAAGEILLVNNALAGLFVSTTHSNTFTTQTWGSNAKCGVHYAPGSSTPYIVVDNQGRYSAASSIAGLTGSTALPGVSTLASPQVEIADNGGTTIVIACRKNTDTTCSLFSSTDGGTTYTLRVSLTGAGANLIYAKALGVFVCWDSSGRITISADGTTWSVPSTNATSANGFLSGPGSLACAGPVIAKLWQNVLESGVFFQRGVAYSFDLGVTWNTWTFADVSGSSVTQLRGINNRLYALDPGGIWVSGPVSSPQVEI